MKAVKVGGRGRGTGWKDEDHKRCDISTRRYVGWGNYRRTKKTREKKILTRVGFEPTRFAPCGH